VSAFRAGVLTLVVILVAAYFGFTKSNPFADPYELTAVVRDAQNLKPGAPVREAGVEVGKVSKVEAADGSEPATKITMELVTLPDVLSVLGSDTRSDLQTLLREYATAVDGGGAQALNRAIPSFAPAYRLSALTNDALLGEQPTEDLHRVLRNQARVFGTLSENPQVLQDLVSDLNTTAGAIASQDSALEAAVPALRDTLREGYPALGELNAALPTLRAFSREALPGVRSSVPTLDAATPWIVQARGLVGEDELKGLAADLRQAVPHLVKLNHRLIPALRQLRALSSCTSSVLVPFVESPIPSIEAGNSGQAVRSQLMRSFVGLAGESRVTDANTPVFHIQGVSPLNLTAGRIEPAAPANPNMPPEHRPDVPCETQQPPNLAAPGGSALDPDLTSVTAP
jgi:phospholipid/cholesterol/gamma-HCH transport system substrate-binding protein